MMRSMQFAIDESGIRIMHWNHVCETTETSRQAKATAAAITEPRWVRWLLIGVTLALSGLFLLVPLWRFLHRRLKKVGRSIWPRSTTPTPWRPYA